MDLFIQVLLKLVMLTRLLYQTVRDRVSNSAIDGMNFFEITNENKMIMKRILVLKIDFICLRLKQVITAISRK